MAIDKEFSINIRNIDINAEENELGSVIAELVKFGFDRLQEADALGEEGSVSENV